MDKTVTPRVPPGWDVAAATAWAQGQQAEAVTRATNAAQAARWQNAALALQCAYYLFLMNDFRTAAGVLERQSEGTPDNFEVVLNLAVMYGRLRRWADAERAYARAAALEPGRFEIYDGLAHCLYRLGRLAEAADAGTRSLELKDRLAGAPAEARAFPVDVGEFVRGKHNVLSFTLWGRHPGYLRGMLRNVLLAPDLYPGWTVRIHLDDSVPADFVELVASLGAQVVRRPAGATLREKLAWRFEVANDPQVGRFLVRDADSVIGVREVHAVNEWIASGRCFHVMRDFWTHTDLILAGMWGGVAGVLPELRESLATYRPAMLETPNVDQWFLRDRVWAHVRASCLVHDRCFHPAGAQRFPGPLPEGSAHVGQNEFEVRRQLQAQLLGAWFARCPSLGND